MLTERSAKPVHERPDDRPKISVVTVVRNKADTIEDAILSVAGQNYPHVEHIVIDGASTDGTTSIIGKHRDKLAQVVSERDDGMYDAMNKGVRLARGDVIGTLNADDFYSGSDVLAGVAEVFKDPDVGACYADLVYVDRGTASRVVRFWRSSEFHPGLFGRGWCPPHPTFFVRRTIYEKHGGFDLSYRLAADVELMMRFLETHRVRATYVPHVWVKMRVGGTSNKSLTNIVIQNLYIAKAARKNKVPFNPLLFFAHKLVDRARQFRATPKSAT
jgi:glycosyltransferase involved in cell wall biosynthesis